MTAGSWQISVYEQQELIYSEEFTGPVELGRQHEREVEPTPRPYSRRTDQGHWRVILARQDEAGVSRKHALVEPLSGNKVRVSNLSAVAPIKLSDGSELKPNSSRQEFIPTELVLGSKRVRVHAADGESGRLEGLRETTPPPGAIAKTLLRFPSLLLQEDEARSEALIRWLQSTLSVFQSAACSSDFYEKAAQALVDVVGLNSGWVLRWDGKDWQPEVVRSAVTAGMKPDWRPSRQVLVKVLEAKTTFYQLPEAIPAEAESLREVKAVVAAPILNQQGEVIGALYGDRRQFPIAPPITKVEAMLVQLLATGVAAGLARLDQEQKALTEKVRFEQFFTPALACQLASQPQLLEGRDCNVSILVADINGFSRISERLGPKKTVEWINDVLGKLSECVLDQQGVLVDYTGDELMAMWGAPQEQPDHARLACTAALAMLSELPTLDRTWKPILDESLRIGIGINTGVARVGNIGSRFKFKYGPQGNTVNLASRVQGANKYLKTTLLITGATRAQLDETYRTRRLCTARAVNIAEPFDLCELVVPGQSDWEQIRQEYEKALQMFEIKHFRTAASLLGNLLASQNTDLGSSLRMLERDDGPALVLIERIVKGLREGSSESHPVWQLPGK